MVSSEIPLQQDMFTGSLVDNRTRDQKLRDAEAKIPTQILMFSQRDIAQIGVSPTPRMDLSPGRLKLIAEDPRTPEEIEHDLVRQAQANTIQLFPTDPLPTHNESASIFTPPQMEILKPPDEDDSSDDEPEEITPLPVPPLTKLAAYLALIASLEETTATLEASEPVRLAQGILVSLATHNAKRAGLTDAEITAASVIGKFRGTPQEIILPSASRPIPNVKSQPIPVLPTDETVRSAETYTEDDMPIVWVKRADLVKRRPDLREEIANLNNDELTFLAERVGDALEEFYWIQLNIVLSLFLDHKLALHLNVPKQKNTRKKKVPKAH